MCICSWTAYNWGESCLGTRTPPFVFAPALGPPTGTPSLFSALRPSEQVHLLTGVSASPEFLKRLTFICYNHDEKIVGIDTVRVRTGAADSLRLQLD